MKKVLPYNCFANTTSVFLFLTVIMGAFVLQACKKEQVVIKEDNRIEKEVLPASKIRVINLANFDQVVANNTDTLTNFLIPTADPRSILKRTRHFPVDGRLGKIWDVPQEILNGTTATNIQLEANGMQLSIGKTNFQIIETGTQAKDYYVWPSERYVTPGYPQPKVVEIPRAEAGPQRAGYFKIRIINLAAKLLSSGQGVISDAEDLLDSYSLAYANGAAVNPITSQIGQARWSDYVELPFGTYQFRVLTSNGRQLPFAQNPPGGETTNNTDPATSSVADSYQTGQYISFAPIKSYLPGGVYTIVVAPRSLNYYMDQGASSVYFQNAFDIIEDVAPPANYTLARLQAVNALPDANPVSLKISNTTVIDNITSGKASDYQILPNGTYKLEAQDASHKVLSTTQVTLAANDNVSAWVNKNAKGEIQISTAWNNLSGTWYVPEWQDNAVYNQIIQAFPFNVRFFNFCPDEPYITFTQRTGNNPGGGGQDEAVYYTEPAAFQNLQPGVVVNTYPYISLGQSKPAPFNIYVFRSKPNSVPGNWITDISGISNQDFIANKAMYNVRAQLPVYERGYYSAALIGSYKSISKPRVIIVKHNQ